MGFILPKQIDNGYFDLGFGLGLSCCVRFDFWSGFLSGYFRFCISTLIQLL